MADNVILPGATGPFTSAAFDDSSVYTQKVSDARVSTAHLITAASTNATSVKASAGRLRAVSIYNNAAYPIYVKFHNTAGAPTPGSGVVYAVPCQAGQARDHVVAAGGRAFATGIGMSVVKGIADADATAVAASDASIEVAYE